MLNNFFSLTLHHSFNRHLLTIYYEPLGFPGGASGKEPTCQCRKLRNSGSVLEFGRSPGEGNGNSLQDSCLEDPMDRVAKSLTWLKWYSRHAQTIARHYILLEETKMIKDMTLNISSSVQLKKQTGKHKTVRCKSFLFCFLNNSVS